MNIKIMEFRGFDSNIILIERGGIPRPIGISPEMFSQPIFGGIILVERLGVAQARWTGSRRLARRDNYS